MDIVKSKEEIVIENKVVKYKTYPQRWYIIALVAVAFCLQCMVWNTYSPIAQTALAVFPKWTDGTIAMYANWGTIAFIVFVVPLSWLIEYNLRYAMLLTVISLSISTVMRCVIFIPDISDEAFTIVSHISAGITGISGPIVMAASPTCSALWFAPNERTTATSIGELGNFLGIGMSFLFGLLIVPDNPQNLENRSNKFDISAAKDNLTDADLDLMRGEIENYMLYLAIMSVAVTILVIIYFPAKPKTPPSKSATVERLDFKEGLLQIVKNPKAWIIGIMIAIPVAVCGSWQSMIMNFMPDMCFSNGQCLEPEWANWLAIVTNVASCAIGMAFSRFMDYFRSQKKTAIILLLAFSGICFTILSLVMLEVISFGEDMGSFKIVVYVLLIAGAASNLCMYPLGLELGAEVCFPVAEGIIGCWITFWFNVVGCIFYFMFYIPNDEWLQYILPISALVPIPFFMAVKVKYRRSEEDEKDSGSEELQTVSKIVEDNDWNDKVLKFEQL